MGLSQLRLITTGRKSHEPREVTLYHLPLDGGFAIVPSNGGKDRAPAWWLNLQAKPDAEVRIRRETVPVRGRQATKVEDDELWPKLVDAFPYYARYRARTSRPIPVVILDRRDAGGSSA